MSFHTFLLILAVIHAHISGSKSKPHEALSEVSDECIDVSTRCGQYTDQCQTNSFVQGRCRKTCGLCGIKSVSDECVDISTRCAQHADQCQTNSFVQGRCKKTCGLCVVTPECPSPWVLLGNKCFYTNLRFATWAQARERCGELASGADLAEPTDLKALHDYVNELTEYDYWYWLGGSDHVDGEGKWSWLSGANITGWRDGEPNNHGGDDPILGEDCLAMETYPPIIPETSLNDRYCEQRGPFICERF